jgi:hypothetical protein
LSQLGLENLGGALVIEDAQDVRRAAAAVALAVAGNRCTSSQADAVLKAIRLSWDALQADQTAQIEALGRQLDELLAGRTIVPGR